MSPLSCSILSMVFLLLSRVSAWTAARVPTSRSLLNQRVSSALQMPHYSSSILSYALRGGETSHNLGQTISPSTRRAFTTLHASVTDDVKATTQQDSNDDNNDDDDDDDLSAYRSAFDLDFPIRDFGGLPYWDTTTTSNNQFRVLFVLGGPGAGKGTQSELMSQHYPVVHLSAGQLLRDAAQDPECPHCDLIQEALVAGNIVPVKISLSLLQAAMEKASETAGNDILFLVDGFPRNEDNLSGWCTYMEGVASIWSVLFYSCPLDVLEGRILERAKNSGRSDDNLESLHKRFTTFESETMPIVHKLMRLSENGPWSVTDIAGQQSLDEVWETTQQSLNALIQHDILSANAQLLKALEEGNEDAYQSKCTQNVLETQKTGETMGTISNAELDFCTGKKVVVSYTRTIPDQEPVRESRTWEYRGLDGWRNVQLDQTTC